MKKYFHFALLAIFAVLISCSEKEEPVSPLVGTWENRVFVDSLDVWFVETLEIKNDSLVDIIETVRPTETGPDLGYRLFMETKYSLEGEIFSYDYSNGNVISRFWETDPLFVPKSELRPTVFDFVISESAALSFSTDFREMDFQPICYSYFEDDCLESKKFVKVD